LTYDTIFFFDGYSTLFYSTENKERMRFWYTPRFWSNRFVPGTPLKCTIPIVEACEESMDSLSERESRTYCMSLSTAAHLSKE
jgi:hypothetical protein